jgi:hypothetical protein
MQAFKIPTTTTHNHNKVKAEKVKEAGDRTQQEIELVQLQKGVDWNSARAGCSENWFLSILQFTSIKKLACDLSYPLRHSAMSVTSQGPQ